MTWDASLPVDGEKIKLGDDRIRELKTDLETALKAEGVFPVDVGTPRYVPRGGMGTNAARPAAASGGFYYDTDNQVMTVSDGTNWKTIGIPSGEKTVFYQAAAPVGWVTVPGYNNYTLRAVSGTGGGSTAGTSVGSYLSHTHGSGTLKFQTGHIAFDSPQWKLYFYDSSGNAYSLLASYYTATAGSSATAARSGTAWSGGAQTFYTIAGATTGAADSGAATTMHSWLYVILCQKS